jgi:retron-type reverse transcriptase
MNLQEQLCSWENLWLAAQNAARGKRGRAATAAFEYRLADNLLGLQTALQGQTYRPGNYHSFFIHEPKRRLISAAPFRDRVVHHALCQVTTTYFERRFIPDSYANRLGKGTHRALDRCQQYARQYPYVLQCDVVRFFPSIDHAILRSVLLHMLPDDSLLWLIDQILNSGAGVLAEEYHPVYFPGDDLFAPLRPRGLPIGNLTSQWWANCYLNPLDQFIKRELSVNGYLRYVDDFLLFSDNKKLLWEWRLAIIQRLQRYRLTIHEETAFPRPVMTGIPFLGFMIYPDHRLLKRRKGIAYQRKLKYLLKTAPDDKIRASVQAWINHARYGDTYGLRKSILERYHIYAREDSLR